MKQLDNEIKSRALQNLQTTANNANPSMEVIVTRPRTPIFNKRFWQESIITPSATATCTTVAVRKTGKNPDRIYVSYISGGSLVVKSAMITFPVTDMAWTIETTVANCIACSLEFDGSFIRVGRNVEYRTEEIPWLFYVTSTGAVMCGILGSTYDAIVGSSVTSIDVVRGIASQYKDIDQGLICFYTYGGGTYYNQLIAGVWLGQEQVDIAPANALYLKCERLFDYRIVLHVTDSAGALWEVFTKMYASGWNGTDYIDVTLSQISSLIPIDYLDYENGSDNISVSIAQISTVLYALAPVMLSAYNVDDGLGNTGIIVKVLWDEDIFDTASAAGAFSVHDSGSGAWAGQSLTQDGRELTITFLDFNNAQNPCRVVYTAGPIYGDVAQVASGQVSFISTGLIPTELPEPLCIAVENTDAKTIILTFDIPVASTNLSANTAAIAVTSLEYDMIPEGTTSTVTYVDTTIGRQSECTVNENVDLATATLTDAVVYIGILSLLEVE